MQQALALATRARGQTAPNPMVGCVVVRGGRVVGQGYHARAGTLHAEPLALQAAGRRARGADLYVTLEPCHHTGRTGPCTAAIVAAGIRRVFVGARDYDDRVAGRGIAYLRQQGIAVTTGVAEQACHRINEAYDHAKRTGEALVVAKVAQSLDGCVATHAGRSQWITGAEARDFGHRLRGALDAIVVGRQTVVADDPALSCRTPGGRDPLRVILDSQAQTSPQAQVVQLARTSSAATVILCAADAPLPRCRALQDAGAEILQLAQPGRVQPQAALQALCQRGVHSVLLEGGPTVLGSFFDAGLVSRLYAFVAPVVLGGAQARHSVLGTGVAAPADAWAFEAPSLRRLGLDWLVHGRVVRRSTLPPS